MSQTYATLDVNDPNSAIIPVISNDLEALRSSFSGNSAPSSPTPTEGQQWWDADADILYIYNGTVWEPIHGLAFNSQATNYTLLASDRTVMFTATATASLPTAASIAGRRYTIIRSHASQIITIDPSGAETIGGRSTLKLIRDREAVTIESDGTNWKIIAWHRASDALTCLINTPTTAGTTEENLQTFTLPGGTLAINGEGVRIEAWLDTAANANNKACRIVFGATEVIAQAAAAFNADRIKLVADVYRTGAATQIGNGSRRCSDVTLVADAPEQASAPAETLSGDIVIYLKATTASAAGDITCKLWRVTPLPCSA